MFCAAYRADEFAELLQYADHIVFNSPSQLAKFGPAAKAAGKSVGLRLNPECSTQEGHAIYDPCAPGSRLGTTRAQWDAAVQADPALPELLDRTALPHPVRAGCRCTGPDAGGGGSKVRGSSAPDEVAQLWRRAPYHPPRYRLATLEQCITKTQKKYGVQVYLEPGEAWALNAGYLVTTVLDTLQNGETSLPFWTCLRPATPRM